MSDLSSIGYTPASGVSAMNRNSSPAHAYESPSREDDASPRLSRSDRVELSESARAEHARWLESLRQLPPIRTAKVEAVKQAIETGIYESPARLEVAIERLLEDLQH